MKVALALTVTLLLISQGNAQLPGVGFLQVVRAVTTIHRILSNTPLRDYLPGPLEMARLVWEGIKTARNIYNAVRDAQKIIRDIINAAGSSGNMSPEQLKPIIDLMESLLGQMMQPPSGEGTGSNPGTGTGTGTGTTRRPGRPGWVGNSLDDY